MIIDIHHQKINYRADLSKPLDISIPIQAGTNNPNCYWAEDVLFQTISSGDFIGSVKQGGSVNYQKLTLTPHGNGTHTECYGHISSDDATINNCMKDFHAFAELVTLNPQVASGDLVVTLEALQEKIIHQKTNAIIIRTLPNDISKKSRKYSNTNPPYLEAALTEFLALSGYEHLLIDLPSVDKEVDGGVLATHKAFWGFPDKIRKECTITELIYVPASIADGLYLLNLQIISLEMDASPSKPLLFKLEEVA